MIGANGAGKSTLLKAVVGMHPAKPQMIRFDGEPIGGMRSSKIVARGITMVPEGRRLFPSLTVEENLSIGAQLGRGGPWSLTRIFELFPMLAERRGEKSTSLSGGQQQMVAFGRALMSNPRLLLCDEISLGLAPIVVRDIFGGCRWSSPRGRPSSWLNRTSCRHSERRITFIACKRVVCC